MRRTIGIYSAGLLTVLYAAWAQAAEQTVGQKDKTFVMKGQPVETLNIAVGDVVHFKNEDPFFHNVFSLSDIKTFDLGSYPAGQSKSVTFDKPGTVDVECAIHPQMHLTIEVK